LLKEPLRYDVGVFIVRENEITGAGVVS